MDRSRRSFLAGASALFGWSMVPRSALALGRDPRFVLVILRGGLDSLYAVPPVGDPDFASLRGGFAPDRPLPLPGGFFGLHPAMKETASMFAAGQALIVHALATPYRERSHFDGQDVLESGQPGPGMLDSGFLNRLCAKLPAAGDVSRRALAVGVVAPLVLRGPAQVLGWAPPEVPTADADLQGRVMDMWAGRDPALSQALVESLATAHATGPVPGGKNAMAGVASGAAKILAASDGPRIAALSFLGWDTHARERQRLDDLLGGLDAALAALRDGLGPRWRDTVVLCATEFGRTAHPNGTEGSDHGTGTVAILTGGALKGGRVIADWPGLSSPRLLDGRDLRPTTDLRSVLKGVLAGLFDVPPLLLEREVFPDSIGAQPLRDLVT